MLGAAVVALTALAGLATLPAGAQGIAIKACTRTIDLTTAQTTITTVLTLSHDGQEPAPTFRFLHTPENAPHAVHVEAATAVEAADGEIVAGERLAVDKDNVVKLAAPLGKGETARVRVVAVYTHTQQAHPAEIPQGGPQLVVFRDSHYLKTSYHVKTQTTVVKLPSQGGIAMVETHSELDPTALSGDTLTYGPYKNVAAKAESPLLVHYESTAPFLTVTKAVREFSISHWAGMVSVAEKYEVRHDGGKLKGGFSRYDHQRSYASTKVAISSMRATLPVYAEDLYYRDLIGNISTSHMLRTEDAVIMDIEPRYPLFGGWATNFVWGYSLPSNKVLFKNKAGKYVLRAPIGTPLNGVTADEVEIRVVLPEFATGAEVRAALPVEHKDADRVITYLDLFGRPVVAFTAANIVDENGVAKFEVAYDFSTVNMAVEPGMLVVAILAVFVVAMAASRLGVTGDDEDGSGDDGGMSEEMTLFVDQLRDMAVELEKIYGRLGAAVAADLKAAEQQAQSTQGTVAKLQSDLGTLVKDIKVSGASSKMAQEVDKYLGAEKERQAALRAVVTGSAKAYKERSAVFKRRNEATRALVAPLL